MVWSREDTFPSGLFVVSPSSIGHSLACGMAFCLWSLQLFLHWVIQCLLPSPVVSVSLCSRKSVEPQFLQGRDHFERGPVDDRHDHYCG